MNRFIRQDSLAALDALAERISIHRSIQIMARVGAK